MKQLLMTGRMFLGGLVIVVVISQVLDVVMSRKTPTTVQNGPSSKPDGGITHPSQPGPGPHSPLLSSAQHG